MTKLMMASLAWMSVIEPTLDVAETQSLRCEALMEQGVNVLFFFFFTYFTEYFKFLIVEFNRGIIRFLLQLPLFSLCFSSASLCKSCTGTGEFVSQSSVIIIEWSVCAEQFVPFSYKINNRRLSILQGAVCSSWGRFRRKRLRMLSHSQPLENCN